MQRDRDRWNEKYRKKAHSSEPSSIVKAHYLLAPTGRALDIATGNGRNALFLADRGFTVEAVDIADEILKNLSAGHAKVHPVCADLDDFDITGSRYSLILNIRFLNRRLFPYIQEGLIPGGILIFETYMDVPHEAHHDAFCRDYLLRTNELLHAFLRLNIIFYAEGKSEDPDDPRQVASLVAMKPNSISRHQTAWSTDRRR